MTFQAADGLSVIHVSGRSLAWCRTLLQSMEPPQLALRWIQINDTSAGSVQYLRELASKPVFRLHPRSQWVRRWQIMIRPKEAPVEPRSHYYRSRR